MDIKILVACHRKFDVPSDPIYFPVHVGTEGKAPIGFTPDSTGDNISAKNPMYCELTGLYWAWKNLSCDYIGLVHYSRYFAGHRKLGTTYVTGADLVANLNRLRLDPDFLHSLNAEKPSTMDQLADIWYQ